jgi:DNA repair protein RadC
VREGEDAWKHERLLIMFLDEEQQIVGVGEVPAARVTAEHIRGILQNVPRARAAGFISVHGQPRVGGSGSVNDAALLKRLRTIAAEIGMPLLDHVRFRRGHCHSMVHRSPETD